MGTICHLSDGKLTIKFMLWQALRSPLGKRRRRAQNSRVCSVPASCTRLAHWRLTSAAKSPPPSFKERETGVRRDHGTCPRSELGRRVRMKGGPPSSRAQTQPQCHHAHGPLSKALAHTHTHTHPTMPPPPPIPYR